MRDYLLKISQPELDVAKSLVKLREFRESAWVVEESPGCYMDAPAQAKAFAAAREFIRRVSSRYAIKAAFLFGSRARGTHVPDSDVDIAVVLLGTPGKLIDTALNMADLAFDVLVETDVYIEPFPILEGQWERSDTHSNPRLIENIRREGITL